jgi:hypothetical protein
VALSFSEYTYFKRLYFVRLATCGVSGFAATQCVQPPRSGLEVLLLIAISICVGQLAAHLVTRVGFWIWLKKFGMRSG